MLEHLGKKRYALPFVVFLVVACAMSMVVYPMVTAEPKNLPLGILSLDEGAETPQGPMNAGEAIVAQVMSTKASDESEAQAVAWTTYETQEALDEAIANEELYAAVVIPADFSASQVQAQMAEAQAFAAQAAQIAAAQAAEATTGNPTNPQEALPTLPQNEQLATDTLEISPLSVIIDEGKNPMAASTVETMLTTMLTQQNLPYTIERVDEVNIGSGSLNMAQQFTVIPTFIMTMICSVALYVLTRAPKTASRRERWNVVGIQAALAVCLSWLVGFGTTAILETSGLSIPSLDTGLFLWLASFCLMLLFVGCLDIAVPFGAVVILICFAGGMACGNLPYELLPTFYQDWLYPWVPQHFIGDGVRQIFYTNGTFANSAATGLVWTGIIGAIALCVAPFIPHVTRNDSTKPHPVCE